MVLDFRNDRPLSASRFLAAALSTLAMIMVPGLVHAQAAAPAADAAAAQFEVAAIKPSRRGNADYGWHVYADRITVENYTMRKLIMIAYDLSLESQIRGGPKWLDHQAYDIVAKIDDAEAKKMQSMSSEQKVRVSREMLQSLLADRFQLKMSESEMRLPVYALVISASGARLQEARAGETFHVNGVRGRVEATATSMPHLAHLLGGFPESRDRPVLNQTGLKGNYDFRLNWTRDDGQGIPSDAKYPGLFTALKEQLGLELKPEKAPVRVVVVESACEPTLD